MISEFIDNIINDAENEMKDMISDFIDNIINDAEKEMKDMISDFIDNIISDAEEENKEMISDFIDNIIKDAEEETKVIISDFIDNIIKKAEIETKTMISDFIDNIINDAEQETMISDFIDNLINDAEEETKNMISDFIDTIINNAEKEIKDIISNFIDNILNDAEKELKDMISDFIDNILNDVENDDIIDQNIKEEKENKLVENNKTKESKVWGKVNNKNLINKYENKYYNIKNNNSINIDDYDNNIYNENKFNEINNDNGISYNKRYEKNSFNKYEDKKINPKNNPKALYKNQNKHNLMQSVDLPNVSKKLDDISSPKNDLFQSQEFPNTHIILTKYNLFAGLGKKINKNFRRHSSVRREYQFKTKYKIIINENLQIFYDNSPEKENKNYLNNSKRYERIYIKAKSNKNKNRKTLPLNNISYIERLFKIQTKLKNIIIKEPIKKLKFQKNIKHFFKKWKNLGKDNININFDKNKKIIINNFIYKACPNQDNEMIYKLSKDINNEHKDHYGYYNSNICICYPINIRIYKGVFYLINDRKKDPLYNKNFIINNENDEDLEIFVFKKNKKRRLFFQKNDNYTFNGTL